MEFFDRPLLSYPDLSLLLLKAGQGSGATVGMAVRRVQDLFRVAEENPPPAESELFRHLGEIRNDLVTAGLLAMVSADVFRTTSVGERMMAAHPLGLDPSVLASIPAFRASFPQIGQGEIGLPGQATYSEGYAAFRAGRQPSENPYFPDSADYQFWQNGWSQARDEDQANAAAMRHPPASGLASAD